MQWVRYGGRQGQAFALAVSEDYVAIRTHSRAALATVNLSRAGWEAARGLTPVFRLGGAGVEVHRVTAPRGRRAARDRARETLPAERDVAFAGRVLCHPRSREPVVYTENLFVQFREDHAPSRCRRAIADHDLALKREIPYLRNAYFVSGSRPEGCGMKIFAAARRLLEDDAVLRCHPELVWEGSRRQPLPFQWHLGRTRIGDADIDAHASVEAAWALSRGAGTVIAVIDDGFDIDHEELASPGKIVAPRDATHGTDDPRPGSHDDHGTPCVGVACADGLHEAAGVAPAARLMPVRLVSGIGSQDEADAIQYAAEHGADVISCSWGPKDGDWQNPADPLHQAEHPLPDATRLALEWASENGRGGRGCVITWAAGNGGPQESVDDDGYARCDRVVAVAAVNDEGRRCPYGEKGAAVWCCFPSNDPLSARTTGIWTLDRSGRPGFNPGRSSLGDRLGHYTNRFQGTSSACPGVAGVAALVLSVHPDLTWRQVRELLKDTADRVDLQEGQYDDTGHSPFYGYGRVNAERAVRAAAQLRNAPVAASPEVAAGASPSRQGASRGRPRPRARRGPS